MSPEGRTPHSPPLAPAAALLCVGTLGLLAPAGCSVPPPEASFSSSSPQERVLALREAAARDHDDDYPALIAMLDSDDPAQRMFAQRALESRTGQTLGYSHADPEPDRRAAAARWADWWTSAEAASTSRTDAAPLQGEAPSGRHQ